MGAAARKAQAAAEAGAPFENGPVENGPVEKAACNGCDLVETGVRVRGPAAAGAGAGSARLPRTAHLGTGLAHTPPRSRAASRIALGGGRGGGGGGGGGGKGGNHSIPAGGAVWPTAIYWTLVQVG